ncbi:MAG TPA: DUF559 domain-containing protein [Actinomycetes bacterium]|nr:DUF559 domain-containing protein [Actinomycetes bacterium]
MLPSDIVRALGGHARWHQLHRHVTPRALRLAVRSGQLLHTTRGPYLLPTSPHAARLAADLLGVRSHTSAAQHWQLGLVARPDAEHVTVSSRARRRRKPADVVLHYRDLRPDEVIDDVTSPIRTVLDCARDLPLREALAVGDSALRSGLVDYDELRLLALGLRGPGSARTRQFVTWLDARSANAFESATRAILLEAGVTGFRPQVTIRAHGRFLGRVDLANVRLRIVIECDGFAWHGQRSALVRDCRRYDELTAHGWAVLRLAWEQVMFEPEWVLATVQTLVAQRERTLGTDQHPAVNRIAA